MFRSAVCGDGGRVRGDNGTRDRAEEKKFATKLGARVGASRASFTNDAIYQDLKGLINGRYASISLVMGSAPFFFGFFI